MVDEECSNNRRHLRSFERKYRKSNTIKNLTSFRQLQCQHNHLLQKKRSNYNLQSITDAGRDQKRLFKLANDLLGRNCKNKLPNNETDLNCAQNFSSFFNSKINIIINSLPHCFTTPHSLYDNTCLFETFIPPTTDLIIKLIKSSKSTSLNDPLPISILHQLARLIAPHLQSIICRSLLTASFPDSMKNAIITPQIKNIKSDPNDLKSYRPISQLKIFSKIFERCISHQIVSYLTINNILHQHKSAYTPCKSTETALCKVVSDIQMNNHGTLLVLLDMSAAFDTLNHDALINRLFAIGFRNQRAILTQIIHRKQIQ